jgi:hypothetical protein
MACKNRDICHSMITETFHWSKTLLLGFSLNTCGQSTISQNIIKWINSLKFCERQKMDNIPFVKLEVTSVSNNFSTIRYIWYHINSNTFLSPNREQNIFFLCLSFRALWINFKEVPRWHYKVSSRWDFSKKREREREQNVGRIMKVLLYLIM